MLTKRLKANGGFTEWELATIRALVKAELDRIRVREIPSLTVSPARLKNLKSIAYILEVK